MFVTQKHIVPEGTSKIRLLDYALTVFATIPSKSSMKKTIKKGGLLVNGISISSGSWISEGQLIELLDLEQNPPKPYHLELEIIYEDEHLAVINKPAGIEVSGNKFKTIQNALVSNIGISKEADALKWARPAHRLDRPTSGLLLVAKTATSLMKLGHQLENHEIQKRYRAIVAGNIIDEGKLTKPINNQDALTTFKCVNRYRSIKTDWISLIDCYPHSGRTHQLRIHLAEFGFPIVGEKQYCDGPILKGKGLFLASVGLVLYHPISNKLLDLSIKQPEKFDSFLSREQKNWESKFN